MKMTQTLRLILGAALLTAAVAVLWWIVGFALGKSALEQSGAGTAFARLYAFREGSLLPLFALALLSYLTRLVGAEAGAGRWLRLAVLGGVAGLVFGGEKAAGAELGWVLFVFAAAAAAESSGVQGLVGALVAGVFVAFAFVVDKGEFGAGQKVITMVVRDVFFFVPLLVGPEWLDRWLWRGQK